MSGASGPTSTWSCNDRGSGYRRGPINDFIATGARPGREPSMAEVAPDGACSRNADRDPCRVSRLLGVYDVAEPCGGVHVRIAVGDRGLSRPDGTRRQLVARQPCDRIETLLGFFVGNLVGTEGCRCGIRGSCRASSSLRDRGRLDPYHRAGADHHHLVRHRPDFESRDVDSSVVIVALVTSYKGAVGVDPD